MEKLVSIVILNWNGKSLLEQFLPSVTKFSDIDNVEIVLADNGSTDKSIQFVKANYPQIKIIDNKGNFGFAGGYNKSLENLQSKYFILLNSDVELSANWLPPLIAEMESDDTIFACQPKLLAFNEKTHFEYAGAAGGFIDVLGYPFCRGRIMDYCEKDEGQYDSHCEIFWASGACMMVRADLFKKAGGFDTDFFAHMEEIDLCWRMKNLGYKITFVPNSVVYHVGAGTLKKSSPRKTYLNFYNNRVMVLKNQNLFPFIIVLSPTRSALFCGNAPIFIVR
jgi:GT2 family glycosyltransferase